MLIFIKKSVDYFAFIGYNSLVKNYLEGEYYERSNTSRPTQS